MQWALIKLSHACNNQNEQQAVTAHYGVAWDWRERSAVCETSGREWRKYRTLGIHGRSNNEWKGERASEWSSEWDEKKNIDHHHHVISIWVAAASKLLTCHGTAMMNRWTAKSRDFYKCVSEREQDRVRAKIKKESDWRRYEGWESEWVIEWVRWKTSIIIITSSAFLSSSSSE